MRKTIPAPFTIGRQNYFGVGLGAELVPLGHQEASKFQIVVDLTVEYDGDRTCFVLHGLMAARRKVDDGQPPLGEADGSVGRPPGTAVIGSAVLHRVATRVEPRPVGYWRSRSNSGDSAHQSCPLNAS